VLGSAPIRAHALIEKGLRRRGSSECFSLAFIRAHALIEKGLRPALMGAPRESVAYSSPRPDREGIKTAPTRWDAAETLAFEPTP